MDPSLSPMRAAWDMIQEGWVQLASGGLEFARADAALIAAGGLLIAAALGWILRARGRSVPGKTTIGVPAVLPAFSPSPWRALRHIPALLFLVGLLCFLLALADPFVSIIRQDVSHPGRRIALLVDASGSMASGFKAPNFGAKREVRFFTAVKAAEHFVRLRMSGQYRDLISLIEFGNEAFVITPFTNDYENILLSVSLIGEPEEWNRWTESGTVVIRAVSQAVGLFKTFGYLRASGNLMVLISDGQDTQVLLGGRSIDDIMGEALDNRIPIYFIRTGQTWIAYPADEVTDKLWSAAVAKTGGKFYPVADADRLLQAIRDIDKAATGRVMQTRYGIHEPRFAAFTMATVLLWSIAGMLRLATRLFGRFP